MISEVFTSAEWSQLANRKKKKIIFWLCYSLGTDILIIKPNETVKPTPLCILHDVITYLACTVSFEVE